MVRLAKNTAPSGQLSVAQHAAEGGVLGKVGKRFESRRDGRVLTHTLLVQINRVAMPPFSKQIVTLLNIFRCGVI